MTQVEWHPYPEEKDKVKPGKDYFVTLSYGEVTTTTATNPSFVGNRHEFSNCYAVITAFAEIELPEPYKPEEKNESQNAKANESL